MNIVGDTCTMYVKLEISILLKDELAPVHPSGNVRLVIGFNTGSQIHPAIVLCKTDLV